MRKLIIIFLLLISVGTMTSCKDDEITFECGEWGECVYENDTAENYISTIEGVNSIVFSQCLDRISINEIIMQGVFDLKEDGEYGVCLLLVDSDNGFRFYSYGSTENTKLLEIDVNHTISDLEEFLALHSIEHNSIIELVLVEWGNGNILIEMGGYYFDVSQDEIYVCESSESSESCISETEFTISDTLFSLIWIGV